MMARAVVSAEESVKAAEPYEDRLGQAQMKQVFVVRKVSWTESRAAR
jgi:hypothetical protein